MLPNGLTEPSVLSFDQRCSVREVLDPVVKESEGNISWADPRATPPDWPGPVDAMRDVVGSFIMNLVQAVGGEASVRLEECLSGLEITFPARPLRKLLQPSLSTSAEVPSKHALEVIGSFLRLAHFGCVYDILSETQRSDCRIRIGFDVSRVERAPSDPYEELAADLVGNELFWSRFVD